MIVIDLRVGSWEEDHIASELTEYARRKSKRKAEREKGKAFQPALQFYPVNPVNPV
jgi:hypothetical protein